MASTPITGNYLLRLLAQTVHQPYTNFLGGTVKANRLFLNAFLAILNNRYDEVEFQKYREDISYLIQTQKTFLLNNNQIYEAQLQIVGLSLVTVTATITTQLPHNLLVGDGVSISGVTGFTTNPNGTRTVLTTPSANSFTVTVTASAGTYTAGTGKILILGKMIADYWQMDQVSARYDVLYNGTSITGATNATPIVITLSKRTDLRTGSRVFIASGLGNTNVNGTYYVKQLNDFMYSLYTDSKFLTPVAGNGTYTGSGVISKVNYNVCKPFLPKTKISPLNIPTPDQPRYEDAEVMLKFYPMDSVCKEIMIDYMKNLDNPVDTSDTVTDLSLYYNAQFLTNGLISVAARIFAEESRDTLLYEQSIAETKLTN